MQELERKEWEAPEMEITTFEVEDVITVSMLGLDPNGTPWF